MNAVSLKDCPYIPWKNGGGVTQELFKKGDDPFLIRISVATVTSDGAFSLYPDHNRILYLLNGSLKLSSDSEELILPALTPYAFSGSANISSQLLEGELRDFNIFYRKDLKTHAQIVELKDMNLNLQKDQMLYVFQGEVDSEGIKYSETLFLEGAHIKIDQAAKGILIQANLSNCNKG